MTERVIIETDEPLTALQTALAPKGIRVEPHGDDFLAHVPDSRDAEEAVTDALCDAGVEAFVYLDTN